MSYELPGFGAWLALCAAVALGAADLSWIDLLLALAPLAIVPLGLPLALNRPLPRALVWAFPVAAAAAVASLLVDEGAPAALLAGGWLAVAAAAAVLNARPLLEGARDLVTVLRAAAVAYLAVAAGWLVLFRAGADPISVGDTIVEMTAVHFHYAGFAATAMAACAAAAARGRGRRLVPWVAAGSLAGPPLVAAGFTFSGVLQVLGAVVLTLGLWALAILTAALARREDDRRARALLVLSSAAVVVPMALAVQWALGQHVDVPALSIPDMGLVHGSANALGFAGAGLLGWRLARRAPA